MEPIKNVKPKDSSTLTAEFILKTGATHYIIRIENINGFFREDTVSSSPAELSNLSPYTEYSLSIMAANSVGRSQPSISVTAKTGTVDCHIAPFIFSDDFYVFLPHSCETKYNKKSPEGSLHKSFVFIKKPTVGFSSVPPALQKSTDPHIVT